ncbi:Clathrin adaptor alpha/beta/gamma-adaptin appendage Ig-like subdomain-containing protein [Dioscorea alata]|uniref:Clathrin adaptor alpha/beta/gamma-adaptin appendage Ig-like subdomain-containing protein n=3 Tax=Dioscorea alata TaxID=55571 RepID=A0ACB7WL59_DIOAL|nr:Clathrin adaptor alpha/beta/gamma-adaptin appendage Ig-like subdomain-containing protein [Dioscorea alata]KAH7688705.1 Clathrin adaptor alpha/beta/gamma-adaptin appendage Ig-like subdomain-containing protein [Dioscorea alata]KAH7688706.1 Clathrin adaptor alpha/beta/gamma-adaptin appendage Ig-like subdomain-containing protein [Dioscorea alata]
MHKFPERQSALLKKAEDTEVDSVEQSAIKLHSQQQVSNALVVTDQHPPSASVPVSQPGPVKVPSQNLEGSSPDQGMAKVNGTVDKIDAQPVPSADLLGDLLGPLAIEGSPGTTPSEEQNPISGYEAAPNSADALALSTLTEESDAVQIGLKAEWRAHHGRLVLFLGNKNTSPLVSVRALILPPAHLKMEFSMVPETIPPRAQVQCPLEVVNLRASRGVAVLDFSYKFGTIAVNIKLRLPAVLNKFLQPISVSAEEFFPQWKSLSGPPLKLQEVVRGVKPMPIPELANLFTNLQLAVTPGLDTNPNNLVASTTFFSDSTKAMLCLKFLWSKRVSFLILVCCRSTGLLLDVP